MANKKRKANPGKRARARGPARKVAIEPAPARIARVAKGKKPQYFSDPAIDKLLWMTLTLTEELSVTRDRLDTVERLLEQQRLLSRAAIEGYVPAGPAAAERSARRAAFVDRVMRAVHAELEEVAGGADPGDAAMDPVSAVSS